MEIKLREMISKIPKFDLLDGQRRGEVVARRVILLIAVALLVYLILLATVGEKENVVEEVKAVETVQLNEGDTVNGQRVSVDEDGKAWFIQEVPEAPVVEKTVEKEATPKSAQFKAIESFTEGYRGSRIDDQYLGLLADECSDEALKIVVAISVSESGMGRDLPKRQSNFWGWFKNNNRNYDPSREQMAKDICKGVEDHYMNVGDSWNLVVRYTGNSKPTSWYNNFKWAMNQMEVQHEK